MPKWIKGRNGKFLGSIGLGKKNVPVSAPYFPSTQIPGVPDPFHDSGFETAYAEYERLHAQGPAAVYDSYLAKFEETVSDDMFKRDGDFSARMSLQHAAEKYAATDEGQVAVLQKALEYAEKGSLEVANTLSDAALAGQKAREASLGNDTRMWKMSMYETRPSDFDRIDQAYEEFYEITKTPFHVEGWGDNPSKDYPFNNVAAGEKLAHIAGIIDGARFEKEFDSNRPYGVPMKKQVFSESLIEEARKLARTRYVPNHPGQEQYPHSDVTNFLTKVRNSQRASRTLVTGRLRNRLTYAQSVLSHNTNPQADPFSF